jgi:hypothetical protein
MVYGANTVWNRVGGLYIFAYQGPDSLWYALYVGQTNDFASRIPGHDRWAEARRLGATHIHARTVDAQLDRDVFERVLIKALQPPLNEQQKK